MKKNMLKIGGFQSFRTAGRTIAGSDAIFWLREAFGFAGDRAIKDQKVLLARLFGLDGKFYIIGTTQECSSSDQDRKGHRG